MKGSMNNLTCNIIFFLAVIYTQVCDVCVCHFAFSVVNVNALYAERWLF